MKKAIKTLKTIRRYAVHTFTAIMAFILFFCIAAVDSNAWWPYIGIALSTPWLVVYMAAVSEMMYGGEWEGDEE